MIQNARVLKEDWVPQELVRRGGHLQHLSRELKPIAHGLGAESIIITGPSGTGKTTIAEYIVRQLKQEVFGIRWGYVNAISETSMSSIIYSLVGDVVGMCSRRSVKVLLRCVRLRMMVVPEIDALLVDVMEAVVSLLEPSDVEPTPRRIGDAVRELYFEFRRIQTAVESRRLHEAVETREHRSDPVECDVVESGRRSPRYPFATPSMPFRPCRRRVPRVPVRQCSRRTRGPRPSGCRRGRNHRS